MARIARVVVPGVPHHITQRGNRKMQTFFSEDDYRTYIGLMARWCRRCGVDIWAYCLMPNHVHLIAVPKTKEALRRAIGEAHRRYTQLVNNRQGWRGYLWQGRFGSFPMDERHMLIAAKYVELNPVRAGLVVKPEKYPWSSVAAHISGRDDALVTASPLLELVGNWKNFLLGEVATEEMVKLRLHQHTGRPLGSDGFVEELEKDLDRNLRPRKRGRKSNASEK